MTRRDLTASAFARVCLGGLFAAAVFVIYLPLLVMILFSFNSGRYQTLPFREPTIAWYARAAADRSFVDGLLNSIALAGGASVLATSLGFLCAYALVRARIPGKTVILAIVLAPLVAPLILIGIGMRLQAGALGLEPALWLVLLGQTVYVLPLAVINLRARIAQTPPSLEEAAMSLGAGRWRAMAEIVAPSCAPALAATALLTFTFAFDEFVIAYFLTNFDITLPIKIWTTLVTGFDPTINAVGTLVFVFSLAIGLGAQMILLSARAAR